MKAIIFDIGGVIIDDGRLKERLFKAMAVEDTVEFWDRFNLAILPACRGVESLSQSWIKLAKDLGINLSQEEARSLWIDDFQELISINSAVLNLVDELRQRYLIGVVSNTIAEHADIIRDMGVYSKFHHVVLSHEVGIAKDDPAIFDIILEKLSVKAHEAIFIDDVRRFALSAESIGMQSIVFQNAEQLVDELGRRGLMSVS